MKIAIIPARSGSKRIKNKNIKDFCGKPIIGYAIACVKDSGIFDKVIVSTESKEIMDIALQFGADFADLRDERLSDDWSNTLDVMSYEVKRMGLASDDIVCCVYPTTPLLKPQFLKAGLEKLKHHSYCFSACAFRSNPLRGFFLKNGKIHLMDSNFEFVRSQDLDTMYYDAGQFYFGYAINFANKKSIFSQDSTLVLLPEKNVVDINTQDDWEIAEIKYKILCKQ